jgi:hypothetical protein
MARAKSLQAGSGSVAERVREEYSDPFALIILTAEAFGSELPTAAERTAFIASYADWFLEHFDWITDPDNDGQDYYLHVGPQVFQRGEPFFARVDAAALGTFEPPNPDAVKGGRYGRNWQTAIAAARGRWFRQHKLRITKTERAWLREQEAPKVTTPSKPQITKVHTIEKREQ